MEPLVSENQIFIKLYLSLTRFDSFYFYSCSNDHITVLMLSCYFSNTLSVVAKRQCYSSGWCCSWIWCCWCCCCQSSLYWCFRRSSTWLKKEKREQKGGTSLTGLEKKREKNVSETTSPKIRKRLKTKNNSKALPEWKLNARNWNFRNV